MCKRLSRKRDNRFTVIFFSNILRTDETALCTTMHDSLGSRGNDDTLRRHGATTEGSAVPWILVYMFAPQAFRAVVCVTVPGNGSATMIADEVFFGSGKAFHGVFVPRPSSLLLS